MEKDLNHVHLLISYDKTVTVSDIVKKLKQETTYYIWQKHYKFLIKQYWKKRICWSDGYFVCIIKEVSSATIQKYIEKCETSSHHLKVVDFCLKYLYEKECIYVNRHIILAIWRHIILAINSMWSSCF